MKKVKAKRLAGSKWLSLYVREYGENFNYYFCSRRKEEDVGVPGYVDAVRVLPYFEENGKIKVAIIKNYRYPLENETYELPAGLAEQGEDAKTCAIRETEEEVGAEVISIDDGFGGYAGPGLADEFIKCYIAKVKLTKTQHLDETEVIKVKIIDVDEIPGLMKEDMFCLQSKLMLLAFYYMVKAGEVK